MHIREMTIAFFVCTCANIIGLWRVPFLLRSCRSCQIEIETTASNISITAIQMNEMPSPDTAAHGNDHC